MYYSPCEIDNWVEQWHFVNDSSPIVTCKTYPQKIVRLWAPITNGRKYNSTNRTNSTSQFGLWSSYCGSILRIPFTFQDSPMFMTAKLHSCSSFLVAIYPLDCSWWPTLLLHMWILSGYSHPLCEPFTWIRYASICLPEKHVAHIIKKEVFHHKNENNQPLAAKLMALDEQRSKRSHLILSNILLTPYRYISSSASLVTWSNQYSSL